MSNEAINAAYTSNFLPLRYPVGRSFDFNDLQIDLGDRAQTHHRRQELRSHDVKDIRRALILASKLMNGVEGVLEPGAALPLSKEAFEVGLLLSLSGVKAPVVQAGFLSNSLRGYEGTDFMKRSSVIARKFGNLVFQLVSSGDKVFSTRGTLTDECAIRMVSELERASVDQATLWCGTLWSRLGDRLARSSIENDAARALLSAFKKKGVPSLLVEALQDEFFPGVGAHCGAAEDLQIGDLAHIKGSIELSSQLFGTAVRSWGPREKMLLAVHAFEVGLTLALAGADKDTIIAGLLHDAYEGYVSQGRDAIRTQILELFGSNVSKLVEGVTEPAKNSADPMDFARRKEAVLDNLKNGDKHLAMVSCAAKISTIAAGNKHLYATKGLISRWSRGSIEDNVRHFEEYLAVYREKNVPQVLIEQFELELTRFRCWAPSPTNASEVSSRLPVGEFRTDLTGQSRFSNVSNSNF